MNWVFKALTGIHEQLMKKQDVMLTVVPYTAIHEYPPVRVGGSFIESWQYNWSWLTI